jgi:class 3 adenylate cyclase
VNHLKPIFILFSLVIFIFAANSSDAQSSYELFKEGKDYRSNGKKNKAIKSFEQALKKAESDGNKKLQMSVHLELAELKDNVINYKEALAHYKAFSSLYKKQMTAKNDQLSESVNSLESEVEDNLGVINDREDEINQKENEISSKEKELDSLTTEKLQVELSNKDLELDNQQKELELQASENRRNTLFGIIGTTVIILLFFGMGYIRKRKTNHTLRNKNYQIAKEKEKSEELLLNILPPSVAAELKEFGKTTPSKYETATVMFTDFKGFTKFSEKHSPEELVTIIGKYFSAFDQILEKYAIEKIKTIGDAYLCVSGIPQPVEDHAKIMIDAARELNKYVQDSFQGKTEDVLQMRIGIHTGPLVAGVVGSRKFAYDIWGDTVNIAARMEQSGEAGKINVSESTFQLAKDHFEFEYRGEVEAKNKGKMKMHFVKD